MNKRLQTQEVKMGLAQSRIEGNLIQINGQMKVLLELTNKNGTLLLLLY